MHPQSFNVISNTSQSALPEHYKLGWTQKFKCMNPLLMKKRNNNSKYLRVDGNLYWYSRRWFSSYLRRSHRILVFQQAEMELLRVNQVVDVKWNWCHSSNHQIEIFAHLKFISELLTPLSRASYWQMERSKAALVQRLDINGNESRKMLSNRKKTIQSKT